MDSVVFLSLLNELGSSAVTPSPSTDAAGG